MSTKQKTQREELGWQRSCDRHAVKDVQFGVGKQPQFRVKRIMTRYRVEFIELVSECQLTNINSENVNFQKCQLPKCQLLKCQLPKCQKVAYIELSFLLGPPPFLRCIQLNQACGYVPSNSLQLVLNSCSLSYTCLETTLPKFLPIKILKYRYPPLNGALPPGCWVLSDQGQSASLILMSCTWTGLIGCAVALSQTTLLTCTQLYKFQELTFWELTFWEFDIFGVDISGVDILGVGVLRVDILGGTQVYRM